MRYVCGLLFSPCRTRVALINKLKPAWQKGKLNAIGGKIEANETPLQAMVREFEEETGVFRDEWNPVSILQGEGFEVHFFSAFGDDVYDIQTMTEEIVNDYSVEKALRDSRLMPNLAVMIALALDDSGIVKPVFLQDARAA